MLLSMEVIENKVSYFYNKIFIKILLKYYIKYNIKLFVFLDYSW